MRVLLVGIDSNIGAILEKHIRLSQPDWEILGTIRPGSKTEKRIGPTWTIDLTDEKEMAKAFDKIGSLDAVVQLAAAVHAEGGKAELAQQLNYAAPMKIAQLLLVKNPNLKFIYASTISVYGNSFKSGVVDEETPCQPVGVYAETKFAAERGLLAKSGNNGFRPIVIRIGTVISRTDRGNLNQMIAHIRRFRFFVVTRPRRIQKTFVHVDDLSAAIVLLIAGNPHWNVYNIVGPFTNISEILGTIKTMVKRFIVIEIPAFLMAVLLPKLLCNVPVVACRFSDEFHFIFKTFKEGFSIEYSGID